MLAFNYHIIEHRHSTRVLQSQTKYPLLFRVTTVHTLSGGVCGMNAHSFLTCLSIHMFNVFLASTTFPFVLLPLSSLLQLLESRGSASFTTDCKLAAILKQLTVRQKVPYSEC
jgi:hypothetical protein